MSFAIDNEIDAAVDVPLNQEMTELVKTQGWGNVVALSRFAGNQKNAHARLRLNASRQGNTAFEG
jgi:hypothetical protein